MSGPFQNAVGTRVRVLRERSGLTQREFAAMAGFNPAFAGRVERGLQNLTLIALGRIAFTLGVSVATLFKGIEVGADILEVKPRRNARRPSVPVGGPEVPSAVVGIKPRRGVRRPSKSAAEGLGDVAAPGGAARSEFLELMPRRPADVGGDG